MAEACGSPTHRARAPRNFRAEPQQWGQQIRHAGAIFLGRYTSESLGDYCAGPNHVLPTSRTARFSSPLGVYDFQKRSSLIEVSAEGAQTLGQIAAELAYGEGLQAHARSAELRMRVSAPAPTRTHRRRSVRRLRAGRQPPPCRPFDAGATHAGWTP
jgi:histidinol dehydrogenase